jgi:hypothetical protein
MSSGALRAAVPDPVADPDPSAGSGAADGDRELTAAAGLGRIAALAIQGQRDLSRQVERYPELFAAKPFDPALLASVAYATAANAPWCEPEELRATNRGALWVFAADWQLDYLAESAEQIDAIAAGCLDVAGGGSPAAGDPLARFLAAIRDELADCAAFGALGPLWREELERMFAAAAREWTWKSNRGTGGAAPSLDAYLDCADTTGLAFVNMAHWISAGAPDCLPHIAGLRAAGRPAQRILRLVNDLATYDRDVRWGDLNALLLGADRAELERRIAELLRDCRDLLRPLEDSCPRQASYLARQIGFTSGFYRLADFWGEL